MDSKVLNWVREVILLQAIIFIVFAIKYAITDDDINTWLIRWGLAMILLGFWGCMKHMEQLAKIAEDGE